MKALSSLLALVLGFTVFAAAQPPQPFARNERVIFFGDSITTHNYFTFQLEFVDLLRNPTAPMETISRGHAGDTAKGGFARWDWDAAPVPSDRVFVMFGMNDISRGSWKDATPSPRDAERRRQAIATYAEYQEKLADKILASGRKLVLVTPSPFDQYTKAEPPENNAFCNDPGLATCADIVRKLADRKGTELVELHRPLTAFLQEHPEFGLLARDRVHPDGAGHLLMAVLILEQMGVLPFADETAFDAKGGAQLAFAYRPKHLPYPRTQDYLRVNAVHPLDGRLTREIVKIANLPEGHYALAGNGVVFGEFDAKTLAGGVDLALLETPSMAQAKSAANAFNVRRGQVQRARRLVGTLALMRAAGVDPSDAAAVDAFVVRRRQDLERKYGGGKNPKMFAYYTGQLDFYLANRDKADAFAAEGVQLLARLKERCQPKEWKVSLSKVK